MFWLLESSSEFRIFLLGLGVVCAVTFATYVYHRYRNADKSYQFEDRTRIELSDVLGSDEYSHHISRTRDSHVKGLEQSKDPRQRLGAGRRGWF